MRGIPYCKENNLQSPLHFDLSEADEWMRDGGTDSDSHKSGDGNSPTDGRDDPS